MINFFAMVKNVFVNNYTKHRLNGDVIFYKTILFPLNLVGKPLV